MVSARMQGGCTCENADYLRVGTGNVEFAALFAPKPLGMTAADDWTKAMPTEGLPGAAETLRAVWRSRQSAALPVPPVRPQLQPRQPRRDVRLAQPASRARHGRAGARARLRAAHARRGDGLDAGASRAACAARRSERAVTAWWTEDTERQLGRIRPRDAATLGAWREVLGGAVAGVIARPVPGAADVLVLRGHGRRLADPNGATTTLARAAVCRASVVDVLEPQRPGSDVVVWTSAGGRAAAATEAGQPIAALAGTARRGPPCRGHRRVRAGAGRKDNRLVENRAAAAYTFGYNSPLVVQRAHDTLAALRHARSLAGLERPRDAGGP